MEKKYLVIGGRIISRSDGDEHYISSAQLMKLYGVNPMECVLSDHGKKPIGVDLKNLIRLEPRFDGDYTLQKP